MSRVWGSIGLAVYFRHGATAPLSTSVTALKDGPNDTSGLLLDCCEGQVSTLQCPQHGAWPPRVLIFCPLQRKHPHTRLLEMGEGKTSGMPPLHSSASFFEKGPRKLGAFITYKLIFPSCEVPVELEWMLCFFGHSEKGPDSLHSGFVGSSLQGRLGCAAVQPAPLLG